MATRDTFPTASNAVASHILAHLGCNREREATKLGIKVIGAGEDIAIHAILKGQFSERVDPLADRTFKKAGGWPVSYPPADIVEPLDGGWVPASSSRGGVDALLHLGQSVRWHVEG